MKKISFVFASLFSILAFNVSEAKILTVSNTPGQAAMYTVVQTAIDNAEVGDTVFVHASTIAYAAVSIKKRIVLLGEGGKPDWSGLKSSLNGSITIDSIAQVPGANNIPVSGTVINGMHCSYLYINGNIKGVIIKNCSLDGYLSMTGSGHIILNNYLNYNVNGGTNVLLMNNICQNASGSISNAINWTISNNIFASSISLTSSTITNNIFLGANAIGATNISNSFSKNLQVGTDLPIGNYVGQSLFGTFSETVSTSMSGVDLFTKKFTFKAGSPAIDGGTDGKDVGVHGGLYPWPAGTFLNGDPGLPKVQSIEVQNAVLAPGAILKVNLKAKSASTKQ
jgi:hypothetical protein